MPALDGSGRGFVPGWTPHHAKQAEQRRAAQGAVMLGLAATFLAQTPKRAFSLGRYRIRRLLQGQAGTCWVHAVVRLVELFAKANRLDAYPVCRRLIGYQGKLLDGGGNPTNGGSILSALEAATRDPGKGAGCAHEDLWPYTDDGRALGMRPPANVLEDGKKAGVDAIVRVPNLDAVPLLIDALHPVAVGMWWPYGWDRQGGTIFHTVGAGTYGHALTIIGHAEPGVLDAGRCFELDNWHDDLYAALPPELAAQVEGYATTAGERTASFWVPQPVLQSVLDSAYFEMAAATSLAGFRHLLDPASAAILAGWGS